MYQTPLAAVNQNAPLVSSEKEEGLSMAILLTQEGLLTLVASDHDMVEQAGGKQAGATRHERPLAPRPKDCQDVKV